jgi:rhodanese-related sulfurtransferase
MSKKAARRAAPNTNRGWLLGGLGFVILIVVVVAVLVWPKSQPATSALAAEISVAQAAAKRNTGAFILDVRQPDEWAEYHVPGSTLIPLGELEARVKEVPRDKEVVVVCRSGNRSQSGRDILLKAGFNRVTSMAGGLKEWQAAGLATVTGP